MNLHSIVSGAIGAVNQHIRVSVKFSLGSVVQPSGNQIPTFSSPVSMMAQVQPLTWRDLQQLDGLNLNGTRRKIYLNGSVDSINRVKQTGGDLIIISAGVNAGVYLVAQVLEQFADWVSCAVTLQDEDP